MPQAKFAQVIGVLSPLSRPDLEAGPNRSSDLSTP
jgi:hypothetical protein